MTDTEPWFNLYRKKFDSREQALSETIQKMKAMTDTGVQIGAIFVEIKTSTTLRKTT